MPPSRASRRRGSSSRRSRMDLLHFVRQFGEGPPDIERLQQVVDVGIRGSQYVSLLLSKIMRESGIRPSMGSISSPWGNAAMESLMGIAKSGCVHARTCAAREEAALDLSERIEVVCNRAGMHSALGYLSPAEFEEANRPKENSRSKAA